jgi:uncharacterized protein (TIGR03118 family)
MRSPIGSLHLRLWRSFGSRRPQPNRLVLEQLEDRWVPSGFQQVNLVSDLPNVAQIQDTKLVNPWGVSYSATSPFWVSNNGSASSTLYQGDNTAHPVFSKNALEVSIPDSQPTGQVNNSTQDFKVPSATVPKPAIFIFASQTGQIFGWNGGTVAKLAATVDGASYTGLAKGSVGAANYLYAADFGHHNIAVFDGEYHPTTLAGSFSDPAMPHSYAPFNIQNLGGKLYVTYAQIDHKSSSDESDRGAGFVDVFDTSGNLVQRIISGNHLNAPWGIAIAPSEFGEFSNDLLVGNFGNGRIQAFDPKTGAFLGVMKDAAGKPIVIDGLWALIFGNGGNGGSTNALYFTAGLDDETHGLFGSLRPVDSAAPAAGIASILANAQATKADFNGSTRGNSPLSTTLGGNGAISADTNAGSLSRSGSSSASPSAATFSSAKDPGRVAALDATFAQSVAWPLQDSQAILAPWLEAIPAAGSSL